MQNNKPDNLIVTLSFQFALDIIKYTAALEEKKKYVVANQLLKSGTSNGANIREAQNSESIHDFIYKMKIAAKEADETEYWLLLCNKSENFPNCNDLLIQCERLIKVLSKIIASSKRKAGFIKPQ